MDDYLICVLLLFVMIIAANILTCLDLAFRVQDEPTSENFRDGNHRRMEFLHSHRELIKLGVMQMNAFFRVIISYTVFYLFYNSVFCLDFGIIWSVVISLFVSVVIYVIFVNLLPSVTFSKFKGSVTGRFYHPLLALMWVMYPTSKAILWLRNASYSEQLNQTDKPISMEELSDAVEIVSKVNTMEEKRILTGMVRFANAYVEDIMCHRTEIVAIDYSSPFSELKALFCESGFSRIPVYKGNSDNIIGIIHLKDILPHIERTDYQWQGGIHKPLFANNIKPINELLLIFQSKKEHMAIVVDEYGSTLGLVTMEDILEEIVGEINDEFDEEEEIGQELADGTYIVEGKTSISEFIDMLSMDEDTLEEMPEEIDTVAGLIVELLQDFPKIGSTVVFNDRYNLTVLSMDRHRIDKIKVEECKS